MLHSIIPEDMSNNCLPQIENWYHQSPTWWTIKFIWVICKIVYYCSMNGSEALASRRAHPNTVVTHESWGPRPIYLTGWQLYRSKSPLHNRLYCLLGGGGFLSLVSFRNFLRLVSCLLKELLLRTSWVLMSFPMGWNVSIWRKVLCQSALVLRLKPA